MKSTNTCEVCGISSQLKHVYYRNSYGMCLCPKHAGQMRRHGAIVDPTPRTTRDKNEIVLKDDHAEMVIRNKKNEIVAVTLIDLDDVEKVSKYKWNVFPAKDRIYIYTRYPQHMKLHRFILGYFGQKEIDHINQNPLDNRRINLRVVTRSENASNTNAKHIYYTGKSWRYEVVRYGKRFAKSGFKTYEDAAAALQKCLSDVSRRVNELIDQFNEQAAKNPYKGVCLSHKKYVATFYKNNKTYRIGSYETPEEAHKAREAFIKSHNL